MISSSIDSKPIYTSSSFKFRVVLCRIRLVPILISKVKWLGPLSVVGTLGAVVAQNHNKDIDSEQYTRPMDTGSFMGSHWNTREIVHLFDYFENFIENSDENKKFLLESLGWTLEDWFGLR